MILFQNTTHVNNNLAPVNIAFYKPSFFMKSTNNLVSKLSEIFNIFNISSSSAGNAVINFWMDEN